MDRERWKTVNEIFHAALELPASERREFVCTASQGDTEIQSDVDRLLEADENAGSYLESTLLPVEAMGDAGPSPSPFKSGDVLKDRFRILRQVGEGGMGHVFEAYDTELKVRVALKAIRAEIAGNPTSLEFFRREVRTARTITHPNVCRTFDLDRGLLTQPNGAPREFSFLTMEFLEGETLAARLNRAGPLSPEEALLIARQIASGLEAAHTVGIIHRDVKPANIMLVVSPNGSSQQTRAVITDFGLARNNPINTSTSTTAVSHGGVVGTLAYMAPEQLQPDSPVSAATDIYAFGLVLFEMVTGARAFSSDNFLSGIARRLTGPTPNPQSLAPDLPTPWCRAIEGCIRLKPADRFQSAANVIDVLNGRSVNLPRVGKPSLLRRLTFASWPFRHRLFALAAVSLAGVTLFLGIPRLYKLKPGSKVDPGALVYLAPVKNETGDKAFDNLTELIQAGLTQSAQINLLDQGRVGDTLQTMKKAPDTLITETIAREIALRTQSVRVVFATVTGSPGRYSLDIDIQEPDATSPMRNRGDWSRNFSWSTSGQTPPRDAVPPELLTAIRNASNWIRIEIGESANDIARLDVPPENVTTGNWEALEDYSYAERLAAQQKRVQAVSALRSAVQKDPDFALAYARLGDILVNLNQVEEGYRAYLKALDDSNRNRLSLRERYRIKGIYAQDTEDYQASEDAFREYSLYYEHDYVGWFYRARPLSMLGRTNAAIEVLKQAHQIDPQKIGAVFMLVRQSLLAGDINEANRWANELRAMHQDEAAAHANGIIDFVDGDYSSASTAFRSLEQSPNSAFRSVGLRYLADLEAEEGNYSQTIELLGRAIADDPEDASRLLDRAYVSGMIGDFAQCANDAEAAVKKDRSPHTLLAASEVLGQIIPRATGAAAERLKAILNSLERAPSQDHFGTASEVARGRIHGEILLARGDVSGALSEFQLIDKLEAPLESREYLGRALEARAAQERDAVAAAGLREMALATYGAIALHPGIVWQFPLDFPPGFYATQLEKWLRLARVLGKHKEQFQSLQADLLKLHLQSTSSQPTLNRTSAGSPAPNHK